MRNYGRNFWYEDPTITGFDFDHPRTKLKDIEERYIKLKQHADKLAEALEKYHKECLFMHPEDWSYAKNGGPADMNDYDECEDIGEKDLAEYRQAYPREEE